MASLVPRAHRGVQANMLIALIELDLWEIQRELSKLPPLTNFPQLKIDHFQVYDCFEIDLVAYLSFGAGVNLSQNGHIVVKNNPFGGIRFRFGT
jgi:hypothetical protein